MSECPLRHIIKRDGDIAAYDRDRITTAIFNAAAAVGGSERATAQALAAIVERTLVHTCGTEAMPTVEDIQDIVEETLVREGHAKTARQYIRYRHERALAREAREDLVEIHDNIPYKKIYDALRWNMSHHCDTVEGLNDLITRGQYGDLVRACEERYVTEVRAGAERILERMPGVRIAIIAGPSSSGKTTTTIKIIERLKEEGVQLKSLSVDHYFFSLDMHPKDEFGDYDYETPEALDLALINRHLAELLEGRIVKTPHYDFKSGRRTLDAHELRLEENEILLIDSLHGLYGDMTRSVPSPRIFRLYVETLGQMRGARGEFMRWADNRLMRRMIRDSWHRNLQPLETLAHWHYVRASELKHIIPFIRHVDYVVNSAMPFELPILKHRLFRFFPMGMERYREDPKRQDAYIRAKRVHHFLAPILEMADDGALSRTSLIREFIGGSAYAY